MMQKEEIIGICKFLASDDSSYTTGSLFNIDGGWSSWWDYDFIELLC
jgi:NAD(P)-dependent dehydrogenase (short-subunit alcohol dehydrogenase family)